MPSTSPTAGVPEDQRALPEELAGRYRIGPLLGSGAHSRVVRARDLALERDVAIKLFSARHPTAAVLEEQAREGRLLASLSHRALVTLFDIGIDTSDPAEPQVYLVMEHVDGPDLHERLASGPLDPLQLYLLGEDLCDALDHLHTAGFLHRDVKPSNVLLAARNADLRLRGKLTDVGISSPTGAPHTPGFLIGTAAYVAPEQVDDRPATTASDIYSLGLVLLEALTGVRAYPGQQQEAAEARLRRRPDIPDTLPAPIAQLTREMTEHEPGARPTAADAADRFRDLAVDEVRRRRRRHVRPRGEAARVEAVRRYGILDAPPSDAFDQVTALAARVTGAPIALISIVDTDRVWFASSHRFDEPGLDRGVAFCSAIGMGPEPWAVADASLDPRTRANPLVVSDPFVRGYAVAPLRTHDGHDIGTLSVLDRRPRTFAPEDLENLRALAEVVMHDLELRLASRRVIFNRRIPD